MGQSNTNLDVSVMFTRSNFIVRNVEKILKRFVDVSYNYV